MIALNPIIRWVSSVRTTFNLVVDGLLFPLGRELVVPVVTDSEVASVGFEIVQSNDPFEFDIVSLLVSSTKPSGYGC